jgi:hypothetical protein
MARMVVMKNRCWKSIKKLPKSSHYSIL